MQVPFNCTVRHIISTPKWNLAHWLRCFNDRHPEERSPVYLKTNSNRYPYASDLATVPVDDITIYLTTFMHAIL